MIVNSAAFFSLLIFAVFFFFCQGDKALGFARRGHATNNAYFSNWLAVAFASEKFLNENREIYDSFSLTRLQAKSENSV